MAPFNSLPLSLTFPTKKKTSLRSLFSFPPSPPSLPFKREREGGKGKKKRKKKKEFFSLKEGNEEGRKTKSKGGPPTPETNPHPTFLHACAIV
jgi:hypothetical protein